MPYIERPPANKSGPPIILSSLTTEAAQIEAGRNAIEEHSVDKKTKTAALLVDGYRAPGVLRRVSDRGVSEIGLTTSFSLQANDDMSISCQITLEIPK